MLIKLPDGSQVDLVVGSKVVLLNAAFGPEIGVGPFEVVSFADGMPDLLLVAPDKIAPVSVELIASVENKAQDKVEVKFPDGTVVLVDASLAPVIQAVLDSNAALMSKLADILSGAELQKMQAQLDAMKIERDNAVGFADKLKSAVPSLEAAGQALADEVALLKG